jgi:SAM-dependent methyltransferase
MKYLTGKIYIHSIKIVKGAFRRLIKTILTLKTNNPNKLTRKLNIQKIDLCCGPDKKLGYFGVDFTGNPDLKLDISKYNLPFSNKSIKVVICISAINYFTKERAQKIINEVFRILEPGGIARFGVQDLEIIAKRYVEKDEKFFFQKLNGVDRFEGNTLGDKFAAWFYGYSVEGVSCQYFFDFESLAYMFKVAGFSIIEKRNFQSSRLKNIDMIDNRADQMFFLEAIK